MTPLSNKNNIKMIDSHQHFWQLSRGDYNWLTSDLAGLYRDFLPEQLAPILKQNNVNQTVLIQAADSEAETAFLLEIANHTSFVAGVVGWVDMTSPTVIDRLSKFATSHYFKGIRPMLQDIEDVNWILNDAFTSIFEFLIAHHLTFDALIKEQHLTVIERLAKRYPKLKIVVNHCAKPSLYASVSQIWLRGISEVAKHKNIFIKFSGLLTEAPQGQVSIEKLLPYFNHILDNFGANRIMWGSDWPVLELNGHYFDWTALTHTLISPLSLQAQKSICATNAVKFYNLSEDSSL